MTLPQITTNTSRLSFRQHFEHSSQSTTTSSTGHGAREQPTSTIQAPKAGIPHEAIFHPSAIRRFFHPTHATSYLGQQCKHRHQQAKDAIVTDGTSDSQEISIWRCSTYLRKCSGQVNYGCCSIRRLENFSEEAYVRRIRAETESTCDKARNILGRIY